MNTLHRNAALLIIDVQQGFDDARWGRRNNPQAEENITALLAAWRESGRPVFHTQHMSLTPGSPLASGAPGNQIKAIVEPRNGEPVIFKNVNSAFIGTDLEQQLRAAGIEQVVVTGLTTDHCVSTTARMAGNFGFDVLFVADATATFERIGPNGKHYTADVIHDVHLASLNGEFATVVTTSDLLEAIKQSGRLKSPAPQPHFAAQEP